MKKSCKKIAAFTLSFALIAGNAGTFLTNNNALTVGAATVTAAAVQGKDQSYYDAETQTLHLKGYVRNSSDGSGVILPNGVKRENIKIITADEGAVLPSNCSHFCKGMNGLKAVYLKNADISGVTDMSYMFFTEKDTVEKLRSDIEFVDLSNCDTSAVKTMEGMFKDCLVAIFKLDGIDTSNVTNMSRMFENCGCIECIAERFYGPSSDPHEEYEKSLDLSALNTSSVTDMSYMFYGSDYLSIDLSKLNTSKVKNMSGMFKSCKKLDSPDLSNFDTSNVTDMSEMFMDSYNWVWGTGIYELDLSSFDTSKVTDMSGMFSGTALKSLDLKSFDTGNVVDMSDMFGGSTYLSYVNMRSFDTRNVKDMSSMFGGTGFSTIDVHNFVISDDTNIDGMFVSGTKYAIDRDIIIPYGWTAEKMMEKDCNIFFSGFADVNVIEAADKSYYDKKTKTLHLSGYIRNSDDLSGIILPDGVDKDGIEAIVAEKGTVLPQDSSDLFSQFNYMSSLKTVDLKNADTSFVHDMSRMFKECRPLKSIDLSGFDTSYVTDMSGMFYSCVAIESLDLSSFDTSRVTDMSDMFCDMHSIKTLELSSFDTSNVTNMAGMFSSWWHTADHADISGFDTSKVTNMHGMFYFGGGEIFDLTKFNTSNVTDMSEMFGYSAFDVIDLSSFDTSKVTDMSYMFTCSAETIYVGPGWTTKSAVGWSMFEECYGLVGGAGTEFDPEHTGKGYAHVDGGKDNPGYLTSKQQDLFKTQNLILSGQIGVSFNLDLSSLTDKERSASYMEFSINGRTSKASFNKNSRNASGKYYSFTCYVTSVEMADTITATFHYGNGKTVSKKYSVLDYINAIEKNASSFDKNTLYLIRSISDYGHYSQPFLAASNNWTIGKEHKEMSKHYTNSYSYDSIKKAAGKYQRLLDLGKSDIDKITYSLSLNSGTSLNVFIKAKDNYNGSVKVTVKKGNTVMSYTAVKQADGRYKVTIPNISAHQLGDTYTITASTTNGTAKCSLSALSYVYAVLDGNNNNTAKNAVSSLYIYYDATLNYRSKA